jgi:hypothetical protein
MDAQAKEVEDALDDRDAASREAQGERVRSQQEHRAHDLALERTADPDGMTDQQVRLQPVALVGIDRTSGEVAEAGRHAVDDLAACHELLDDRAAGLHAANRLGGQRNGRGTRSIVRRARHGDELVDGEIAARQHDRCGWGSRA